MGYHFISYNRLSQITAKNLAEDIKSLGYTVWIDEELTGGQIWWDQILEKIRGCDLFIFVLEPMALSSTACTREYCYAADLGKPILPVLISEGVALTLLPPALSQIQYVNYSKQDHDAAIEIPGMIDRLRDDMITEHGPAPEHFPQERDQHQEGAIPQGIAKSV